MKIRAVRLIQIDLDDTEFETIMIALRYASTDLTKDSHHQALSEKLHHELEYGIIDLNGKEIHR